jgi:RES domain-containing protein
MEIQKMSPSIFQSYQDFHFFRRVTSDRRYFRSDQSEQFLRAVLNSCSTREWILKKEYPLYRAQIGTDWRTGDLGNQTAYPFSKERMKPLPDRAHEGRLNPKGIPCLYLATSREVAMSETRPAPSTDISVGRFTTINELKVVDCTGKHGNLVGLFEPADGKIDEAVWATIDRAFSEPIVRREDRADYAVTQILGELFKLNNYDGVAYRSQFGEDGFNIALFDLDSAQLEECHVFTTETAQYKFCGPYAGY